MGRPTTGHTGNGFRRFFDLCSREDCNDAWKLLGLRSVDALDSGMRVRASKHGSVKHVLKCEIACKLGASREQSRVFNSWYVLAYVSRLGERQPARVMG
jgi:hypothetical protein